MLSSPERHYSIELAKKSLHAHLAGQIFSVDRDQMSERFGNDSDLLNNFGCFVTLKENENLRGCIGSLSSDGPLYLNIMQNSVAAGTDDPRFPPVSPQELDSLSYEISVMGKIGPCPDLNKIELGKHGLIVQKGTQQGLLLPQVPLEWNWSREQFLEQTCKKAGLSADAWQAPTTKVLWFSAEVFGEEK